MHLDRSKAEVILRKVRQLRQELKAQCLAPDRFVMSESEITRVVSRMYGLDITVRVVPFRAQFVRGLIERYPNQAVIYLRDGQPRDWLRFTWVKELCHVVNDQEEDFSPKGAETLESYIAECQVHGALLPDNAVQAESFAEIAAIELLYPIGERGNDMIACRSASEISAFYAIPETYVSLALSDDYHRMLSELWTEIQAGALAGE